METACIILIYIHQPGVSIYIHTYIHTRIIIYICRREGAWVGIIIILLLIIIILSRASSGRCLYGDGGEDGGEKGGDGGKEGEGGGGGQGRGEQLHMNVLWTRLCIVDW